MATTTLNDGAFFDPTSVNSGTGNYDSFLRIEASPSEEGYNTSAGTPFDDKGGPWTHSILLSALQVVTIGGVDYYEIRIDLNETNSKTGSAIDLTHFDLYMGGAATATDFDAAGVTTDPNLTKVYSLSPDLPLTDVSNGSGTDDGAIFVPTSVFAGAGPNAYMTLFASFTGSDGGFEEFRALTNTSVPVTTQADLVVTKIPDVSTVANVGDVINYTIDVTTDSTTNTPITITSVTDPLTFTSQGHQPTPILAGGFNVGDANHDGFLEAGEIWQYAASYTVTAQDLTDDGNPAASGQIQNIVTANGTSAAGPVSGQFEADVDIAHISVTKTAATVSNDNTNEVDHVGQLIDYTVTVTNDGHADITGLQLTDAVALSPVLTGGFNIGDTNQDGVLNVGEAWVYTATSAGATQGQLDSGAAITNHVDVTDDQHANGSADASTPIDQDPSFTVAKTPSTVDNDGVSNEIDHVGQVITYSITLTNDGNVDLTNPSVVDPKADPGSVQYVSGDTDGDGVLSVGETWVYAATHTVTQDDLDAGTTFHNVATGTAGGVSHDAPADTAVDQDPAIHIVKTTIDGTHDSSGGTIIAGEAVTWDYTVTNPGNVSLALDASDVTDSKGVTPVYVSGDTNSDGKINPGETWLFQATGTATDGPYANTGTVTTSFAGAPVTDQADSSYTGIKPGVSVDKQISLDGGATWLDQGNGNLADLTSIIDGNTVQVRVVITNTGDASEVVSATDAADTPGLDGATFTFNAGADTSVSLAPGASVTSDVLSAAALIGTHSDTATATGTVTDSAGDTKSATDTDSANYFGADPEITIVKTTTGSDDLSVSHTGDGINIKTGTGVTWNYTVTTTGNVPLSGVSVTDSIAGVTPAGVLVGGFNAGDTNQDGKLEAGESWQFTASGVAVIGAYSNVGTAHGSYADNGGHTANITNTDTSSYFGQNPQFSISKTAAVINLAGSNNSGGIDTVGDSINYTIVVTNTGNVAIHGTIADSLATIVGGTLSGPTASNGDTGQLDVGATWTYHWSYTPTAADLANGGNIDGILGDNTLTNTATFTSQEAGNHSATANVAILPGPGVRTPGFWYNNGAPLWDGNGSTMSNGGTLQIVQPGGDLLKGHNVDVNGDGQITGTETSNAGQYLLIGDWNGDGKTDNGEHTILVTRADALALLNASAKQQGDARWMLARDLVASWLDYLAGNGVGPVDANKVPLTSSATGYDANSPGHYMDDAIQWLAKETPLGVGNLLNLGSGHNTMPGAAVATSSTLWTATTGTGLDKTGSDMHSSLDSYNNTGAIHGHFYAPLPSV